MNIDYVAKDQADRGADPPGGGGDDEGPKGEENTYGLPEGEDIETELRRWFDEQRKAVLGTIPTVGVELPPAVPPVTDFTDPMAQAFTPMLSAYWDEAGRETMAKLGLDPDEWRVVNPHTRAKIEQAAFRFCDATNRTTSKLLTDALLDLRDELIAGVVDRGETVDQLTRRVNGVFDQAEEWRARRIAVSEASRAYHAAELEAAVQSDACQGVELLLSSDACPLCRMIHDECRRVALGDAFAVVGHNADYSTIRHPPLHPGCQCSTRLILKPEFGGPERPDWGMTLEQPQRDLPDH